MILPASFEKKTGSYPKPSVPVLGESAMDPLASSWITNILDGEMYRHRAQAKYASLSSTPSILSRSSMYFSLLESFLSSVSPNLAVWIPGCQPRAFTHRPESSEITGAWTFSQRSEALIIAFSMKDDPFSSGSNSMPSSFGRVREKSPRRRSISIFLWLLPEAKYSFMLSIMEHKEKKENRARW